MPQTLSCIILYSEDFHPDDQKAAKKAGIETIAIANLRCSTCWSASSPASRSEIQRKQLVAPGARAAPLCACLFLLLAGACIASSIVTSYLLRQCSLVPGARRDPQDRSLIEALY